MIMRLFCTLSAAAVLLLAEAPGRIAWAGPPAKPCAHAEAANDGPHGTFMLGLNAEGVLVLDIKPKAPGPKPASFHLVVPLSLYCPAVAQGLGIPAEAVARYAMDLAKQEEAEESSAIDTCPPACGSCTDNPGAAKPVMQETSPMPPSSEVTCPYLQEKEANKHTAATLSHALEHDVLDNLKLLEEAGTMYALAEYFQQGGFNGLAAALYEQVQHLCPGSRLDRQATSKLQEMGNANGTPVEKTHANQPKGFELVNKVVPSGTTLWLHPAGYLEPDLGAPPEGLQFFPIDPVNNFCVSAEATGGQPHPKNAESKAPSENFFQNFTPSGYVSGLTPVTDLTPDLGVPIRQTQSAKAEKRVDKLLEACHKALMAGNYDEAEKLVKKALELDAGCVAAHPLVYKLNLLGQIRDHAVKAVAAVPGFLEWMVVPDFPYVSEESSAEPVNDQSALMPEMPPVDPKVIDALQKVLLETGDPLKARLVIMEGVSANGEETEEPVSQWPYVPPAVDIPSLFGEEENSEAATEAEEEPEAAESDDEVPADLNQMFREVLDGLKEKAWIDIDTSREDGLRAQCEVEVGGVDFKVIWSDTGHSFAVIKMLPAAAKPAGHTSIFTWILSSIGDAPPAAAMPVAEPDGLDLQEDEDTNPVRDNR